MPTNTVEFNGLNDQQVLEAREKFGTNRLQYKKRNRILNAVFSIAREPMVILLLVASLIYFMSGDTGDGIFLSSAIILISAISLYQDSRSRNALGKLNEFSQPKCRVIRNGKETTINTDDLVVGDNLTVEEGDSIGGDGNIIRSNDFSVSESVLTGESIAVYKDPEKPDHVVFRGTTVASGRAVCVVTAVGNETRLGRIGKSLENIKEEKTPLERQISSFVRLMVLAGIIVFVIVWLINFLHSRDLLDSLLKALALAMCILPEEIPVAFTSFMALGAWRLMKIGIIVKQMKTVETLGSATVICTDKTGTLTENKMSLAAVYVLATKQYVNTHDILGEEGNRLIRTAMWASEPAPFDPMEVALHDMYLKTTLSDERPQFSMVHEYPLGGKPPMMTHVFEDQAGTRIIAAKGAPEAMIAVSKLQEGEKISVNDAIETFTQKGYRVLGVADGDFEGEDYPLTQQELHFQFKGLLAFYDPPKSNIKTVLQDFYKAGIAVKIITGDNAATTISIAKQIGFLGFDRVVSGEELMDLNETELEKKVEGTYLFTRMFPEAKLKIINALKSSKEIVAMTGDGVNDGPALKAAHIGIAMGRKGTDIARQAASLILLEDDLSKMVDAVALGRKIYANLKKAIRYIISIHIPIILTVFIPLAFGWIYPNIFSPVHIIFLELIMGPTCSIIYENEPMEKNSMSQGPRLFSTSFFNRKELSTSFIQGLMIALGTLSVYQYGVWQGYDENVTRTLVFVTIISANIFLTLINRSFYYSILTTLKYKNNLVPMIIGITVLITLLVIYIAPVANFFLFETPPIREMLISVFAGFVSTAWYELFKWRKRNRVE